MLEHLPRPYKTALVFGGILILSGCLSNDPIIPMSADTYMVRVEDHAGIFAFNRGKMKGQALAQANEFAEKKGMVAVPVNMSEHPVGVLGDWASVEYQFRLVPQNSPEASNKGLFPRADLVIERSDNIKVDVKTQDLSSEKKDIYGELIKLDDLKKKGIITEDEFNSEKAKLLQAK
jgi:hypothetical protein